MMKKTTRPVGMELFEITPIILGGSAVDAKNKIWLTRAQHFEAVRFWNREIRRVKNEIQCSERDSEIK